MNLVVSNFAWDGSISPEIFDTIKTHGINNVECVLTKIKNWDELEATDIIEYKKSLKDNGMSPYSIQSLFYNVPCDDITDIKTMKSHFTRLLGYACFLGVEVLVFGSPNLRKKTQGWEDALKEIFTHVDDLLSVTNIKLAIEPNAKIYGGEFFNNITDIVQFIQSNNFQNIKTMIDTHNLILENCDPSIEFIKHFDYISHIHISEVGLKPVSFTEQHHRFANVIKNSWYDKGITYELNKCDDFNNAISEFVKVYG